MEPRRGGKRVAQENVPRRRKVRRSFDVAHLAGDFSTPMRRLDHAKS